MKTISYEAEAEENTSETVIQKIFDELPGGRKLAGTNTIGAFAWATTAWFVKSPTRFVSCASTACGIAGKLIVERR